MTHIDIKLAPARLAQGDIDAVANPASLSMQYYRPAAMQPGAPLVVLLHGCRQHPARYAADSGWLTLAQRHGFALLLPGQVGRNNPMSCFSWFDPAAVAPQGGEAASILAMIDAMITQHGVDPQRVFISGLSAGGAMAVALLAIAPGVFAGGGIIAGLPFGAAGSVSDALRAMRDPSPAGGPAWGDKVRAAAPAPARRPPVSIWHGTADRTVAAANAEALEAQWADVQGLDPTRMVTQPFGAHACRLWHDETGRVRLRRWTIAGLGHGTPISPNAPEPDRRLGAVSRFMLESEIGSTWLMARDWGLLAFPPTGQAAMVQATLRAAGLQPWRA